MSMLNGAVLMLLFVLKKGQAAPVQTQHTVMAAVGDEACLSCQLTQLQEVLKVIWWKIWPERETSLCSYYKDNSQSVNPAFIDKVEFKDAGLQNSSIVIRNVTEQDEGCYQCSFKIDHEDYLSGKTLLKVYELHEPVLHVESNSAEEAVVSCSATGRPAPTVTLRVLQQDLHLSNYSSVSVTNTNSTVTVTSTAVLSGFHDDRTQVGCAVRVLSGPQKEVLMMIPEVKQSPADGLAVISVLLLVVLVCGIVAALVFVRLKRRNQNSLPHRNSEENHADKTTEDTHEVHTPLLDQEEIRQLTSEEDQADKTTEDTHENSEENQADKTTEDTHENSEENHTDKTTEDTHEVQTALLDQEEIRQLIPEEDQADKTTEDTHENSEENQADKTTEDTHENSEENHADKTTEDTHEVQTPLLDQEEIRQLTSEEDQADKTTEDTHEVKTPSVEQEKIRHLTPEETNQLNPSITGRKLCFDDSFSM